MRRQAAVLAAFALLITTAPAAFAAPAEKPDTDVKPEVVFAETFTNEITFPFEFAPGLVDPGPCDFGGEAYSLSEVITVRETDFFNRDGSVKWSTLHIRGTSVWTGPDGTAVEEHWAWNGKRTETFTDDGLLILTFTESGNFWNVHAPGSGDGVILHEKGRHVRTVTLDLSRLPDDPFVSEDFEVVGGPHEVYEDGLGALCEAIAPAA